MPRRSDIETILVVGSGPIVIGQAAEFDYSGTQALKVLREDGYRVVLVNSNPATIMTDPEFADATYVEPVTPEVVEAIIAKERPEALLPTLGGQTALNVTTRLATGGVLDRYGVALIGAGLDAIQAAEDRGRFKDAMKRAGIATARSSYVHSVNEGIAAAGDLGYPVMVRPSYILGGGGTGLAYDEDAARSIIAAGLRESPSGEVLVEESVLGWKEYELEVMRDGADNAVIVCSIENLDPMGVHTGDSITVAPAQTLSDREYQEMRDEAIACLREIGVATGGSNVQFAVDPRDGRRIIVEMNPRVSRSSALASKATGFPIAKMAAKLAVGFTLDEIVNDITGATPASFEPALDYVVVKAPRFDFAKFESADAELGTSMQSVGESMAIGRTFPEALQKALRSLETGRMGLNADPGERALVELEDAELDGLIGRATPDRVFATAEAVRRGWSAATIAERAGYDPWFVDQIAQIVEVRHQIEQNPDDAAVLRMAKRTGFSDAQLAHLRGVSPARVRADREAVGLAVTYSTVDTCAAEFVAETPYFYSTFEEESEVPPSRDRSVVVLGSGPNRIGQGVEFDYCCVHAAYGLAEAGYEPVMVNCNPETVSTDYDTSARLYFEPLTVEDVLAVLDVERPQAVIVQLGGQTPLGLAHAIEEAGWKIAGTSPDAVDAAEDRGRFSAFCRTAGIPQPAHGMATSVGAAVGVAEGIGFPVLVRPSYVLGGRAMRLVYGENELVDYLTELYAAVPGGEVDLSESPVLIDRFLESAIEVDVDAVSDGEDVYIGGIMEHVQEAGVHSGDSACILPPQTLDPSVVERIETLTTELARGLGVRGLINVQFAVQSSEVFVIEANPRASRTIPFVSKATGVPLAKVAVRVMMGETIASLRAEGLVPSRTVVPSFTSVKEPVLPWPRFPDEDTILGPEMRATGEVMGIDAATGIAQTKALMAAGQGIPETGTVFVSLADRDKSTGVEMARMLTGLGFRLLATHGTAGHLARHGIAATRVDKVGEGFYDPVRLIEAGEIDLVVNTPQGQRARGDGRLIRIAATRHRIPCVTTVRGGLAMARSMWQRPDGSVNSLQQLHAGLGV
jgi:carbamoyl-phosphate synthase large subunit